MTDTNITIVSQFDVIDAGKLSVAELGKRIHSQRLMLEQLNELQNEPSQIEAQEVAA